MDTTEVTLYRCGKCRMHHMTREQADACCQEQCSRDGCTNIRLAPYTICNSCWRKDQDAKEHDRLMAATPVDWAIAEDSPVEYGGWHYELEYLVDNLDDPRQCDEWCHTSKFIPLTLNLEDIVAEHCSDFSASIEDGPDDVGWPLRPDLAERLKQLNTDINAWWAEQGHGCWMVNYKERFNLRQQVLEYLKDHDE